MQMHRRVDAVGEVAADVSPHITESLGGHAFAAMTGIEGTRWRQETGQRTKIVNDRHATDKSRGPVTHRRCGATPYFDVEYLLALSPVSGIWSQNLSVGFLFSFSLIQGQM